MKVLIVNYEFPPLGGGGGSFSYDLAKELTKNCDIDVLTSNFRGLKKEDASSGIHIHRVPVLARTSLYYATMLSMLSFPVTGIIKGINLCRRKKFDIINTHFAVPSGPLGMVLSKIFNVPNVLSVHGSDIYNPCEKISPHRHHLLRWTVRTILKNATEVIAQSKDTKRCVEKFYNPKREINVIPLGLATTEFILPSRNTLDKPKKPFRIISIGRMAKVKGYDFLIRTIKLLREEGKNVELMLIGDGPEHKKLEKLSLELGLFSNIKFMGWVTGREKLKYLASSDLYVMSSIHEGFGAVLLEAMSCGLPIVATNSGGQTDFIKSNENGLLVPPSNEEALAEAITELIENVPRRQDMGIHNRKYVKQFGINAAAERYLELFRKVLEKKEI